MNRYKNKVGHHSPSLSEQNKECIEELTGLKFDDVSWHNDACDSIANDMLDLQIFLPNSTEKEVDSVTYFNTFAVCQASDVEGDKWDRNRVYSLEEIINLVINNI